MEGRVWRFAAKPGVEMKRGVGGFERMQTLPEPQYEEADAFR